ncbi:MAG: hypothetical protein ING29_12880 [Azospirillum sp.]|nr:hypothetical protein [Azospirillum sp.]
MPHVTTAKSIAFSLDPRAVSQAAWLANVASVATGRSVRKSTVLRLALAELTGRLSAHVAAGQFDALRADLGRLPEFIRCAPAGIDRATDQAGQLTAWRPEQ